MWLKIDATNPDNEEQQNRMEARLKGAFPAGDDTVWRSLQSGSTVGNVID